MHASRSPRETASPEEYRYAGPVRNAGPDHAVPAPVRERQAEIAHPGLTADMISPPDHGENTYRGSGRLEGRRAIVTGADSGIGRAVAIAFAREARTFVLSYLDEEEQDARETARWVEEQVAKPSRCREISEARNTVLLWSKPRCVNSADWTSW